MIWPDEKTAMWCGDGVAVNVPTYTNTQSLIHSFARKHVPGANCQPSSQLGLHPPCNTPPLRQTAQRVECLECSILTNVKQCRDASARVMCKSLEHQEECEMECTAHWRMHVQLLKCLTSALSHVRSRNRIKGIFAECSV